MTTENLFKRLGEWVIRLRLKYRQDEFFITRVRLSALYTILAMIFVVAFSFALYTSLNSRLADSAQETINDPSVRALVISKADGIIRDLIFFGNLIVFLIVVSVGFFLTEKTLKPIREVIKKQDRFIADASHELRTPLSVMKTSIEVTLRRKDLSEQGMRKTLSDTLEEVNILTILANELLNISRETHEEIKMNKILLPELIEKNVKRLNSTAEAKKIRLESSGTVGGGKYVMCNELMINQVFYNLIYNALLYTPENGLVKVNYSVRRGKCVVEISDTGIGISKENLKHIYEPFYRADNSRTLSGSGLGLAIVKSHIDLHFGTISIKSEPGKGTDIIIELPIVS